MNPDLSRTPVVRSENVEFPIHFPLPDPPDTGLSEVQEVLSLYQTPTGFSLRHTRSWMGRDGVWGTVLQRRYFKTLDDAAAAAFRWCTRLWGSELERSHSGRRPSDG